MKHLLTSGVLLAAWLGIQAAGIPSQEVPNMPINTGKQPMPNTPAGETFSRASLNPSYLTEADGELQAAFTCLNGEGEQEVVWSENFDGLDEDNLGGWTLNNADAFSWAFSNENFSTIVPGDVHSLFIEGSYRYGDRGTASAISPEISVPQNATLKGYVNYAFRLNEDYCTLTIFASDNSGETWTQVWSDLDDTADKKRYWHELNIDMTAFAGKTATLKFEYNGYMGDYAIDGLQLTAATEATSIDVMTGETVKFADASTGNPTSWSWSFPGGTPAESTEQYPEVYYTRDGSYDVSLTVSDGTTTSTRTMTAFVNVTGVAPTARIMPPATFRYYETRLPMVAPLAPVQFRDASDGFPTEWEWTFTGVDEEAGSITSSYEENPEVKYMFQHKQGVGLTVSNQHGSSDAFTEVSAEYEGLITNLQPDDELFTFDLGDGYGEFPGTNYLDITEYAEKFSKPSRPIFVYGARVYFTQASAVEVLDQIAGVDVALHKSENGLPGEKLDFASCSVFELDLPTGGTMVGTDFEFSKPVIVDDEFFFVVSGIPEKNETCTVAFATARFRDNGNTAYFLQDGEWKSAADYFPAGSNHTSYAIFPLVAHSVMDCLSDDEVTVSQQAGETEFEIFSYFGYETPVSCDADWCRVISEPNNMTVDNIVVQYDALPSTVSSRTATITLTDGASTLDLKLTQTKSSSAATIEQTSAAVYPSIFDNILNVTLPGNAQHIDIIDISGNVVFSTSAAGQTSLSIDGSQFTTGVYLIKISTTDTTEVLKAIKQ